MSFATVWFEDALPGAGLSVVRLSAKLSRSVVVGTMGSDVGYESWLEWDWLTDFDSSLDVTDLASPKPADHHRQGRSSAHEARLRGPTPARTRR